MKITTDADLKEVSERLGEHPQIIAEAVKFVTRAEVVAKTASFNNLIALYEEIPPWTLLKTDILERLFRLTQTEAEWQAYYAILKKDAARPSSPPHALASIRINARKIKIWIRLFWSAGSNIYQIRWAWNAYRRAELGSKERRAALAQVIELL